jgi:hypothetical protein
VVRTVGTKQEAGQAMPLVLVVVRQAAVVLTVVGSLGAAVVAAAQARTAADAAALAGARAGEHLAGRVAAEHGARLVRYRATGQRGATTVDVTVQVAVPGPFGRRYAEAVARAEWALAR